jgi:hypothetical protein
MPLSRAVSPVVFPGREELGADKKHESQNHVKNPFAERWQELFAARGDDDDEYPADKAHQQGGPPVIGKLP